MLTHTDMVAGPERFDTDGMLVGKGAFISKLGAEGYREFWQGLRANKVIVANGWEDAYYGHFTAASKGDRPIVVSYASSPAAAVYYADPPVSEAPTAE